MAGPKKKYKIQIIKAGIGDPLIAVCFKFVADEGYDNPVDYPVENLQITVNFSYITTSGLRSAPKTAGISSMAKFGTLNYYYLTFPFDQPADINLDQAEIIMGIDASDILDDYTVDFVNGETGYMESYLTDEGTPVPFASLNTRFTYCPGGDCFSLGTD